MSGATGPSPLIGQDLERVAEAIYLAYILAPRIAADQSEQHYVRTAMPRSLLFLRAFCRPWAGRASLTWAPTFVYLQRTGAATTRALGPPFVEARPSPSRPASTHSCKPRQSLGSRSTSRRGRPAHRALISRRVSDVVIEIKTGGPPNSGSSTPGRGNPRSVIASITARPRTAPIRTVPAIRPAGLGHGRHHGPYRPPTGEPISAVSHFVDVIPLHHIRRSAITRPLIAQYHLQGH